MAKISFRGIMGNHFFDTVSDDDYLSLAVANDFSDDTENDIRVPERAKGCVARIMMYVDANTNDATLTLTVRRNAVNTSMTLAVGAATTGQFFTQTNPQYFNSGDYITTHIDYGGTTGNVTSRVIFGLKHIGNALTRLMSDLFARAANTTFYYTFGDLSSGTETTAQTNVNANGVFKNFLVKVLSNTVSATSTARLRINAANGNQSVSIGSNTTGDFEDTVNSDVVVVGDDVCYQIATGATGTSLSAIYTIDFEENFGRNFVTLTTTSSQNFALTRYKHIWGFAHIQSSETALIRTSFPYDFKARGLQAKAFSNTVNGNTTVNSRKNQAAGNQTVTIGASTTGWFEDTTNVDTVLQGDNFNLQVVTLGSSGSIVISHHTMLLDAGFEHIASIQPATTRPRAFAPMRAR